LRKEISFNSTFLRRFARESAKLAQDQPAGVLCQHLWEVATRLLS